MLWRYLFNPQWPVLSYTIVVTVVLFGRALYSFGPALKSLRFVRRLRKLDVCVCWFHCFDHCSFTEFLMYCIRADLRGLCLNGWLIPGFMAAFFASASAPFPWISAWPGIHVIVICCCGFASMMSSVQSRKSLMIAYLDCQHGLLIAFMAVWLSV